MRLMVPAFFALAAHSPLAHAQTDCAPTYSGQIARARSIHRFGSIVATNDLFGVSTFNLSNPLAPVQLGRVEFPVAMRDVAGGAIADGSEGGSARLLVTLDSARKCLISLEDPARPTILADHLPTPCVANLAVNAIVDSCDGIDGARILDIRDPTNITTVAEIPGLSRHATVAGNLLFWVSSNSSDVYDLSDPAAPLFLATLPYSCSSPTVNGDLVFVLSDNLFRVVSFRDPHAPVSLWSTAAGYYSRNGADLYLSPWPTTPIPLVRHYDISNPASPALLSEEIGAAGDIAFDHFTLNSDGPLESHALVVPQAISPRVAGPAFAVNLVGPLAFVAAGAQGLKVYDLTDQASPVLIGTVDTPGTASDLIVQGSYAFIADRAGGVQIVDVADPRHPSIVASSNLGTVVALAVDGDRMATVGTSGVRLYDISNPRSPVVGGAVIAGQSRASLLGRSLWITSSTGTVSYDASDVNNPTFTRRFDQGPGLAVLARPGTSFLYHGTSGDQSLEFLRTGPAPSTRGKLRFEVGGSVFMMSADAHQRLWYSTGGSLVGVDYSNPATPYRCASLTPGPVIANVHASGDLLAVSMGNSGFQIYRAPAVPASNRITSLRPATTPYTMANSSDRLLVQGNAAVSIYDVGTGSNPAPRYASSLLLPAQPVYATQLASEHDFLVACPDFGLIIVDTSDARRPEILGTLPLDADIRWIGVEGNLAVVVSFDLIRLVDVSDPANPTTISMLLRDYTNTQSISLARGLLAIETTARTLEVYDLRNTAAPRAAGTTPMTFWTSTPAFDGRWFYKSTERDLQAFDLTDPDHPVLASTLTNGAQGDLFFHNNNLFSASGVGRPTGGAIFDLADPGHPNVAGRWNIDFQTSSFRDFIRNASGLLAYYDSDQGSFIRFPGAVITDQPRAIASCVGDVTTLTIRTLKPAAFQWRRNGILIPGAIDSQLHLGPLRVADLASYDCLVNDLAGCGSASSSLALVQGCKADVNCDGMVDCFDYMTFVEWYESGDSRCEVNGDDFTDFFDYDEFVTIFEAGC